MNKEAVIENAVTFGKIGARIIISLGTGIAFGGAGMVGTLVVANGCKHALTRGAVLVLGSVGSTIGGTAIAKITDDYVCDQYYLGD